MSPLRKLCLVILAVLVLQAAALPSRPKRQGFSWGDEDDNENFNIRPTRPRPTTRPTPPAEGPTTTTASPSFTTCMRACPVTPQYNPICGTNRVTYNNENHLRCANRCGLSVQMAFGGSCSAL